jgi:hypothetical protein
VRVVGKIVGSFAKFRKATISFVMSICPSFHPFSKKQLGSHLTDFHEILYFSKAIPLQALTGPEDSKRLKLPDFKKIGK